MRLPSFRARFPLCVGRLRRRAFPRGPVAALLLFLCACATTPSGPGQAGSGDALVSELIEGTFKRHPERAVEAGRHEFDGVVGDQSIAAFESEIAWLKDLRARIEAVPEGTLQPAQQHERTYT